MEYFNKTKEKGYAILFTVVIVGVISMIAIGLANLSYKQLLLSSVARDSQVSFYQADTASECGLYADNVMTGGIESLPAGWVCGGETLTKTTLATNKYLLSYPTADPTSPCFEVIIDKTAIPIKIQGMGYNLCDKSNLRTVQRELDVTYGN